VTTTDFWSAHPPGLKWLDDQGSDDLDRAGIERIRAVRYALEPHLEELAGFDAHAGERVVEIGCGIGTDGARFAEGGADYTGVDYSPTAVRTATRAFQVLGLPGRFVRADATRLPLATASADFVWSNGALHHLSGTALAVQEIRRVLRPGGRCAVMLYHRDSVNYRLNISVLRRAGAGLLLVPGGAALVSRVTGEPMATLEGHRALLREHGLRYLTDERRWLASNTDGPGNELSKVFSAGQARAMFTGFREVRAEVRFLNLRILPGLDRVLSPRVKEQLARRWGWHLYVMATR
jgi:SAM-dependent methyltransferase